MGRGSYVGAFGPVNWDLTLNDQKIQLLREELDAKDTTLDLPAIIVGFK
jgi:hypothetical protein